MPIRAYHGSGNNFTAFKMNQKSMYGSPNCDLGIHFTSSFNSACTYALGKENYIYCANIDSHSTETHTFRDSSSYAEMKKIEKDRILRDIKKDTDMLIIEFKTSRSTDLDRAAGLERHGQPTNPEIYYVVRNVKIILLTHRIRVHEGGERCTMESFEGNEWKNKKEFGIKQLRENGIVD